MIIINLKLLIENKVHLGHSINNYNIKNIKYIYKIYKNFYIINLIYTKKNLIKAYNFLYKISKLGYEIIFIGSKIKSNIILKEAALISYNFFIIKHWVPGTFTNINLIKNRICLIIWFNKILKILKKKFFIENKFIYNLNYLYKKIKKNFKGLLGLISLPKTVFLLDSNYENIALKESVILKRNIISILDTNTNPENISIPIPGNDDNIYSIKIIIKILTLALIKGLLYKLNN